MILEYMTDAVLSFTIKKLLTSPGSPNRFHHHESLIKSAALSANTYVAAWVCPAGTIGYWRHENLASLFGSTPDVRPTKTDASIILSPLTPLTFKSGSTTP